ncbi:hypothetical protein Tco_1099579 [Tanacetum coccineum]
MNEDYYHEQNSCYDPNSFGFDQFQPPQYTVNHPIFNAQNSLLNAQNELLNSQNKLMEQMTSICDMAGQIMQKKEEEKRIAEEQAAKDRYWKILICYDDDEDDTIAVTPVLLTEKPIDSLIMEDEHLDTIPATESDEYGKYHYSFYYSLPDYEAFYSDDDHIKEKSSSSTTTHADFSQYDSFIFYLSINPFPPADRSDFYHKEFADELAHIISLLEYDCFCCKIEPELGNLTIDVVGDIFPTREPRVYVPNVLGTHPTLKLDLDFIL